MTFEAIIARYETMEDDTGDRTKASRAACFWAEVGVAMLSVWRGCRGKLHLCESLFKLLVVRLPSCAAEVDVLRSKCFS